MFVRALVRSVVIWIAAAALPVSLASAQITTGTIGGSVRDAQGAIVPGATVTLVSTVRGTTTETQTNSAGDFVFPNVTAGSYLVRVTMDGFKTVERPGVVLSPGDRLLVPTLTIEVGTLTETVTVQAESALIQASSGERSFAVAKESVENLPIAGPDRWSTTRDGGTMQRIALMQEMPNRAKRDAREQAAQARIERDRATLAATELAVRREAGLAWLAVHFAEARLAQVAGLQRENRLLQGTSEKELPAKATFRASAGDVLSIRSPGGGGWGEQP